MIPIKPRVEYKQLDRFTGSDGKRYYVCPEGKKLPSVTTILSMTGDKSGLEKWKEWVGEKEATRISKEAAGLGHLLHTHMENWITGQERPQGNNLIRKMARDMSEVMIKEGLSNLSEAWGIEVPLYFPDLYSGTTDLIGVYKNQPAICDYKNSKKIKEEKWIEDYFCQITAYILAHNEIYGSDIKRGVILMVSRDLQFKEFIIEGLTLDKYRDIWIKRLEEFFNLNF